MKYMLDLFSGLGGASSAFRESSDWEVVTIDNNPEFEPTICCDILDLEPGDLRDYEFEMIWASPPCTAFSVAAIYRHWENQFPVPSTKTAVNNIQLVFHTLYLINHLNPTYWFLENPMGLLRRIIGKPEGTVTYCQYGSEYMKPTDLWGVHPESFVYKKCSPNSNCHQKASRGFDSGTQQHVRSPAERSRVPYKLSKAVLKAVNNPEPINLLKFVEEE